MSSYRERFWIEPNQAMDGLTVGETRFWIAQAYQEMGSFCGANFEQVETRSRARSKIEFGDHSHSDICDGNGCVLGRAWTNGTFILNTERDVNFHLRIRVLFSLVQHEYLHAGHGWDHASFEDRDHVMHPHLTSQYMHPEEVIRLQDIWGLPDEPFWVPEQSIVGVQVQNTKAELAVDRKEWEDAFELRNQVIARNEWRADHPAEKRHQELFHPLVEKYSLLQRLSNQWWDINRRWAHVPMARVS